jgi:tetratricopeptide (TPR) repeat protein
MKKIIPDILICLLIITVGLVIYARIGGYDYILYDDIVSMYVPFVTNGFSTEKFGQAFYNLPENIPYDVAVPAVVKLLLWEFFGGDPGKHHLFSLYMHIACALLLFLFLRSTTGEIPASGFCALLFTVHPLNVEAVSWLSGHNGMLEAFFLLATIVCYCHYVNKPFWKRYLIVFPPFVLGLMSKPTIAILPFLLLLLDYWPFRRFSLSRAGIKDMTLGYRRNRVLVEKIPLIALPPLLWTIRRFIHAGQFHNAGAASLRFHAGAVLDFIGHLSRIFYPVDLAICRPAPPEASLWAAAGLLGAFLVVSLFVILKMHAHKYFITGWFWFWCASAPVILMLFLSGRPVEDHHLYIPLIGVFIMVAFGLSSVLLPLRYGRGLFLITAAAILSLLMVTSYRQTGYWKNSESIFIHALSIHPDNKKVHINLGDAYMGKKDPEKAVRHYRQFLQLSPDNPLGLTKLARALASAGINEEARRLYKKALKLSPDYIPAYDGLAELLIQTGQIDEAIATYRAVLRINPDLFQILNNLALALYKRGDIQEALNCLDRALRENPHYRAAENNRRIIMESLEERPRAKTLDQ